MLRLSNSQPNECLCIALEYVLFKESIARLYPKSRIREIRVTGGGEKSAVWNKIKASVLGVQIKKVSGSEGAPLGSAILAGYGAGVLDNLASAVQRFIRIEPAAEPDFSQSGFYRQRLKQYLNLLNAFDGA